MTKKMSLKAARVNKGLTQEAVARLLKKGKQTICNMKKGRRKIDVDTFYKLCDIYDVDPKDISLPKMLGKT